MLCDKCKKNNATVHIRSVVNGVATEKNLCGYCAANEGYNDIQHNSLAQMLASVFNDTVSLSGGAKTLRCPCCNSTFEQIAKSGKLGCSECYTAFKEKLLPSLKRLHGSTEHIGRIPNKAPLAVKTDTESIEYLKMKLNELVAEEKFEEAATVRDKIKKIEGRE